MSRLDEVRQRHEDVVAYLANNLAKISDGELYDIMLEMMVDSPTPLDALNKFLLGDNIGGSSRIMFAAMSIGAILASEVRSRFEKEWKRTHP